MLFDGRATDVLVGLLEGTAFEEEKRSRFQVIKICDGAFDL